MINGIDVSKHQGKIDWRAVALFRDAAGQPIEFAFIKATEGDYVDPYIDKRFRYNFDEARLHALLAGPYHFARRSRTHVVGRPAHLWHLLDAEREALHFARTVGALEPGDLDPVLDIEWDKRSREWKFTARETVQWCARFCEVLESELGRRPVIYTGKNFWKYKLGSSDALFDYTFWNARPDESGRRTSPRLKVPGWTSKFWQHSWRGRVDGIKGPVDLDRFMGTRQDLNVYAGLGPAMAHPNPFLGLASSNPIYSDALAFVIEYFQPAKPRRAA